MANLGEATAAGRALAEQTKLSYFVASAKTGDGVNEVTKKSKILICVCILILVTFVSKIFSHLVSKLPVEERGGAAGATKSQTVSVAPAPARPQNSDCGC